MQPPFPSGEIALRHAFNMLANSDLGLRGTLAGAVGGGGGPMAEQFATAGMIVREMQERIYDPYRAAIVGAMVVVGWHDQWAWRRRSEKYAALLRLGTAIECPNSAYKAHALAAWSGLHGLDDERWAARIGVVTRTLRRWRLGERGIWTTADAYLRIGLGMADAELREAGIVE